MTTRENTTLMVQARKATLGRTVIAGTIAGIVFNVVGFLTFVLIGSGLDRNGPLLDPGLQSPKMIAVWTTIEPLPLFQTRPATMLLLYVLFGVTYAILFRSVAPAWPPGFVQRTGRLTLIIWALSCLFFELFGPFNLLGEPLGLVALELAFWAVMAVAAAAVIVTVQTAGRDR